MSWQELADQIAAMHEESRRGGATFESPVDGNDKRITYDVEELRQDPDSGWWTLAGN